MKDAGPHQKQPWERWRLAGEFDRPLRARRRDASTPRASSEFALAKGAKQAKSRCGGERNFHAGVRMVNKVRWGAMAEAHFVDFTLHHQGNPATASNQKAAALVEQQLVPVTLAD